MASRTIRWTRYIPEFANLPGVFDRLGADGKPETRGARTTPPTVGELMTHTAGFTYGVFGASPVDSCTKRTNPLDGTHASGLHPPSWRRCRWALSAR